MIPPEVISGLFGLGSSVLSGIGSAAEQRRKWGTFMKRMDMLKPKTPYYGAEKSLSQIDPMVQKIVMGMLGQRGIPLGEMGVDISNMGQQRYTPRTPMIQPERRWRGEGEM